MAREHLYKAKRKDWRELPEEEWWVEGYLYKNLVKAFIISTYRKGKKRSFKTDVNTVFSACVREVEPDTVCEYIGISDKNGRKIFEDDIIKHNTSNTIGAVKWYRGAYTGWYVNDNRFGEQQFTDKMFDECEIIGNIFDNFELLEGGGVE